MVAYYVPQLVPNLSGPFTVWSGLAVWGFALWRGRRYERVVAWVFMTTLTLGILLNDRLQDPHDSLIYWWEGLEFILLAWLAIRHGAFWLILIAAIQLLCLASVVIHRWAPQIAGDYTYRSLYIIWEMQLRIVLFFATLAAMQRTKVEAATQFAPGGARPLSRMGRLGARLGAGGSEWWSTTAP